MRLVYFSRDYTAHDLRFVRAIAQRGWDVAYLRLENDGIPYVREPLPSGCRWLEWAGGRGRLSGVADLMALEQKCAEAIGRVEPDLVHAGPIQSCGLLAALAGKAPTLLMSWGSDVLVDADRDEWHRWATRTALERADFFLCDSQAVLEKARGYASLPEDRTLVMPWGLDLADYAMHPADRAKLREQLGWARCVVAVSTRAWHREYGIETALEAFALAAARQPQLRLGLLGSGPQEESIRGRLRELHLEALVCCPGMLAAPELRRWLAAADIYLATPPSDGTSISLLEAMLYRLPVVVTDNPGNREWVTNGINGYLVPANDAPTLADALGRLGQDPGLRERLGTQGHARVVERADWRRNLPRLFAAYDLVAGGTSS